MTSQIETQVREVFAEDAQHAPPPGPTIERTLDLLGRETGRQRRRALTGVGLAVAAVAAVVAAGAILPAWLDGDRGTETVGTAEPGAPCGSGIALQFDGDVGVPSGEDCSFVPVATTAPKEHSPELSASGDRLLFLRHAPGGHDAQELVVADTSTDQEEVVVTSTGAIVYPTWSPDEQRIAFSASLDGGNVAMWMYDFATRETTKISNAETAAINPSWTADPDVVLYSLTGDKPVSVAHNVETGQVDTFPFIAAALSPDGSQALVVDDDTAPEDIDGTPASVRLRLVDVTTGDTLLLSDDLPASPFGTTVDVAWWTDGIYAASGSTLIALDDQLREVARHDLPGTIRLGLRAGD